jgi:hypothetical protein
MTLQDINGKIKDLTVFEKRKMTDEYTEIVFFNNDIDKWNSALSDILGPALKPAGVKPSKEIQTLANSYGGIYENQTLFKKDFEDSVVMAMYWPWQNNKHTTLKIVLLKK